MDVEALMARVRHMAAHLGLAMGERRRTYNSRRAQELGKWAEAQGQGDAFRDAVYRAYFADGRNIAQVDELVRVAEQVSLPPAEAREILESRTFRAAVDEDWARARALRVTAVPTHFFGDRATAGFLSYEELTSFVEEGGWRQRR